MVLTVSMEGYEDVEDQMDDYGRHGTSGGGIDGLAKLQLPMSCDPPHVGNPPKPLVWLVSRSVSFSMLVLHHMRL